jgi:tRNA(Ile)-lysidine synthetase-like protein
MPPSRPLPDAPDLTLIRPLLHVTRAQIEDYAREHDLHPREDATNRDTTFLRNRLRHETMPMLREINPRLTTLLRQLADVAATDNAYIEERLAAEILPHLTRETDAISLPRAVFQSLHPALQRRFVGWAVKELSDERDPAGYVHVVAAVELALRGQVGARSVLPGGLHLRVDYEALVIERAGHVPNFDGLLLPENVEIDVAVPGRTATPLGWYFVVSMQPVDNARAMLALPDDAVVRLRTRRPGDRVAPLGMGGTATLKDWLIDRKIPRAVRDQIPLLTINGEIAAVLYGEQWPISERFAVRREDVKIVYFS